MDTRVTFGQRATRAGVVVAALLLLTGATWRGISAATQSAATRATTIATPIANAVAGGRDSYADVVKVAAPAVVTIHADGRTRVAATQFQLPNDDFFRRFFGDQGGPSDDGPRQPRTFRQSALGSGVIVTTDGYILTNQHVVDGADQIHVEMTDGRTLTAKVVGSDKPSDLALLKVDASDVHPIAIGNSDAVQVGDVVLAVGNPLGVGQTVTMGIISAKGRSTSTRGAVSYEDFLQTDAPINQGNSGGALVNTKGELIGINSQIVSNGGGNIGIGFAIPANMARHVMDDLRTKGRVTRAQLGVAIQPVTSDMAASLGLKEVGGAIISSVTAGSAADRAGLKRGDVIKAFNGQPVRDINTLRNHVADAGPGSTADITILRDGSEKHVSVKLDEAAANQTARDGGTSVGGDDKTALGLSVAPVTPETASRMRLPRNARGVVVEEVNPDGRAADAGIQTGDIIEEVNRQAVTTVEELRAAVNKTTDRPLLLLVNRQGSEIFVTVRPSNG
jgi:Do/DeqQ family serine protease